LARLAHGQGQGAGQGRNEKGAQHPE